MSIETPAELAGLRAAGRVVAEALRAMRRAVRPGVSTAELDEVGARVFRRHGARSGPALTYGFPGVNCISVGAEAVHGVPGRRRLRAGELVKLDVTAELDGFYADACVSIGVGSVAPQTRRLVAAAWHGLAAATRVARAGQPLNGIGAAIEAAVARRGFAVCPELTGHGIGRSLHEPPTVFSCAVEGPSPILREGLVITVEPIISAGGGAVREAGDGWTVLTADGSLSAHVEHTLVITDGAPLILTV